MLSEIKFRWRLKRLFAEQDALRALYRAELTKARKERASSEDILSISGEASSEESLLQDNIDSVVTRFWIRRAERLFVPVPEKSDKDMWKESEFGEGWLLTEKGISAVRSAVREEAKKSMEIWATIGTILIGVIGAATGLIERIAVRRSVF
jgi:hypothetical protein